MTDLTTAHRLLTLLDLTSLNDADTETDIAQLCEQAVTDFGKVATVCVWPRFVPLCRKWLADTGIRVHGRQFPPGPRRSRLCAGRDSGGPGLRRR